MITGGHICRVTGTVFGRTELGHQLNIIDKLNKIQLVVSEEMR